MGEGRSRWGRTRLVFERNEDVLELVQAEGVVQQQGVAQSSVLRGRERIKAINTSSSSRLVKV